MSSGELRKYDFDWCRLRIKPSVPEQSEFDYSPLGTVFTKGLDKDDQKEGLFKRLRNIEDKIKELLEEIKNHKIKEPDEK